MDEYIYIAIGLMTTIIWFSRIQVLKLRAHRQKYGRVGDGWNARKVADPKRIRPPRSSSGLVRRPPYIDYSQRDWGIAPPEPPMSPIGLPPWLRTEVDDAVRQFEDGFVRCTDGMERGFYWVSECGHVDFTQNYKDFQLHKSECRHPKEYPRTVFPDDFGICDRCCVRRSAGPQVRRSAERRHRIRRGEDLDEPFWPHVIPDVRHPCEENREECVVMNNNRIGSTCIGWELTPRFVDLARVDPPPLLTEASFDAALRLMRSETPRHHCHESRDECTR